MKPSQLSKIFSLTLGLMLIAMVTNGATRYSKVTGLWSSTTTWAETSNGPAGASVPVAGDNVVIELGHNVTVDVIAACANITITSSTFTINSQITVSGNITNNGTLNGGTGILTIGGNVSGTGTFTAGSGFVNYNATIDQTCGSYTYNNLTLSGSGTKTITGVTVIGILSLEGSATISVAPTYGTGATLQYNTSSSYTSGPEWTASFASTGGIIINSGMITLNSAITHVSSVLLNIKNGATLSLSSDTLTISGKINNDGTLNCGSGLLQIGGSMSGNTNSFIAGTGTVEYNGSNDQIVAPFTYYNLELSGNNNKGTIKDISSVITISNNLRIQSGTRAGIATSKNIRTKSLTLDITNQLEGTYGSTISPATNKNDTYFNKSTGGIVTVPYPLTIIANGGGDVCIGSNITLTSTASDSLDNQFWDGPNNFTSSLKDIQLNNITSAMSGNYIVTGSVNLGTNLVFNGNFEKGNIGFTTDYWYGPNANNRNYQYAVVDNPQDVKPTSPFSNCSNHTTSGKLQFVAMGGNNKILLVWSEKINVKKNTNYKLSYWLQSVMNTYPAQIQLKIKGKPVDTLKLESTTCDWKNVTYNWNSGDSTSITIAMYNLTLNSDGNGFALDDISCNELNILAKDTVNVNVKPLSVGGNLSGNTSICKGSPLTTGLTLMNYTGDIIKWQKSNNNGFTSPTDIILNTSTLSAATIGNLTETTYFRAVVQSGPCSSAYSTIATIKVDQMPTASISYRETQFCNYLSTEQPVSFSGTGVGGIYRSTIGLAIDTLTGAITPSLSTPGTYKVTYNITNACGSLSEPASTFVTILPSPIATFAYRGSPIPVFLNGGVAGTFTSTNGLALNDSTGVVNLASSNPGRYTVTNTVEGAGGCSQAIATAEIGITSEHTFAFIWTGTVSTDWNTPQNWLPGLVPNDTCDVVIPDAETTNYDPLLPSSPEAIVRTIKLESNSILNGGTGTTMTLTGSSYAWQCSGLLNPGTSTIKFTNTHAGMSGATSFNNVLIATGAELTPKSGNLMQIAGAMTVQGKLNANANPNTIEFNGTDQSVINPNGSVQGYYNLLLSGSGTKSLPAAPLTITGNCSLNGTVTANMISETTVGANLAIERGCILNVFPNINLTVTGSLTNNNDVAGLVLKSDETGTASLIHHSDNVPATVQRYIPGAAEAWHFISSPVSNQSISGSWLPAGTYSNGHGYDLYLWHEPSSCWIYKLDISDTIKVKWNIVHPETDFIKGQGYLYSLQAVNPTNTFTGLLNNGIVTRTLTNSSTIDTLKGFNFIGNPYPSAIDWQASTGWDRTNLANNGGGFDIWIWNPKANNYGVFNSATGLGTHYVTRYIAAMQGFFVQAKTNGGDLIMDNSVRVHDTTMFKNAKIYQGKLNVKVKSAGENSYDEVMLLFGNKTNNTGTRKLFSNVSTAPSLYLPSSGEKFTVRYLTDTIDNPSVPLMFKPGHDGSYTLETNFNFNAFETVTLEDRKMHLSQNLKTNKTYSFQSSISDDPNRFVVCFSNTKTTTHQKFSARVYTNGFNLVVDLSKASRETIVNVYDILGRRLLQNRLPANSLTNLNINPKKQILLISLINPDGNYYSKVLW